MPQAEVALMAHLMRRAGFGAARDELEAYVAKGYEATVEELLHPENAPPALENEDIIRRYHIWRKRHAVARPLQDILVVSHDQHKAAVGRKDSSFLAWGVCHRKYEA